MKILLIAFAQLLCLFAIADNPISGNTSVSPNSIETYQVTWGNVEVVNLAFCNVTWTVTHGTILESTKTSVTIQWDDTPSWLNIQGFIEVSEDLTGQIGSQDVLIVQHTEEVISGCNGILGPANVAENFGAGPNPGSALPAQATSYVYNSSCNLQPNQYTRSNRIIGCNPRWRTMTEDHTPGDINGYMLVVDGSATPGVVYTSGSFQLLDAFSYEFSAFVANLVGAPFEEPRLRFQILDDAGNPIAITNSFTINFNPNQIWQRISYRFTLPPGTQAVAVRIINDHSNELGNDFAVDDISFAPCFPPIIASFAPNPTITGKAYACNNGSVNLYGWWPVGSLPFANPVFKWQRSIDNGATWLDLPNSNTTTFSYAESLPTIATYRIYAYQSTNPSIFVVSNELRHFVQKLVVDPGTTNLYNCSGVQSVTLPARYRLLFSDPFGPTATYAFSWTPSAFLSNSSVANPTLTVPSLPPPDPNAPPGAPIIRTYQLTVTHTGFANCMATNTETVAQYNPRKVAVPSAFTPDGDGLNDIFRPINLWDYPGGKFWVFNRWGQQIFFSEGPTMASYNWNGTFGGYPQPPGTYVWKVAIPGCPNNIINASGSGNNQPNGTVILIR